MDQTQIPPFGHSCRVSNGVVTEMTGWANAYWCEHNDALLIPDGVPVAVGWRYDGQTFTDPALTPDTLPEGGNDGT